MDEFNNSTSDSTPPAQSSPYRYAWQGSAQGQQAANQVRSAYKQYTGADLSDDALWNQHLNWDKAPDAQFMGKIIGNIANSSEAQTYRQQQANPTTTPSAPPPPGGSSAPPPAAGSPVSANGTIAPAPPAGVVNAPTPAVRGQEPNQTRYVQPVDLSGIQAPAAATAPTTFNDGQNALMSAILANPETMNPLLVSQLKEQQKEQALLMQRQGQQGLDQSAAARGVLGGATTGARSAMLANDTNNNILTANRGVDTAAAAQNRQDELNALSASIGLHGSQLGDTSFNAGQQQQNYSDRVNQALQQFGVNNGVATNAQQNNAADISNWLGKNSALMDWLRYGENQRQFNDTLGLNYNTLNSNGQNSLLQFLVNSGAFN